MSGVEPGDRLTARRFRMEPFLSTCLVALVGFLAIFLQGRYADRPRFDGAGYAVLARSLIAGTGYRAIDHPDRPRHGHFPPGYPVALALVWSVTGPSNIAAHGFSTICTIGAIVAAFWWFRSLYPRKIALMLGLALALNWEWARMGSAIQSEPLYLLLGQLAILASLRVRAWGGPGWALALGLLLGAAVLTRQVAIGLCLAILFDLALRRRWRSAVCAGLGMIGLVTPWLLWLGMIGGRERTQADLLLQGGTGLFGRLLAQGLFYLERIPDQIMGPFVEVATRIRPSPGATALAIGWCLVASGVVIAGWLISIDRPRKRLAGLIALATLGLLLIWPYEEAGRFLVPLIPCLLIGAVEGMTRLMRLAVRRRAISIRERGLLFTASLVLLVVSAPYTAYSIIKARATQADPANQRVEAAYAWLARNGHRAGPVLARHPGEVFLSTGRPAIEVSSAERPGDANASIDEIDQTIDRYRVVYLLIDEARYANAPTNPLSRYAAQRPDRVRKRWESDSGGSRIAIYEVTPRETTRP